MDVSEPGVGRTEIREVRHLIRNKGVTLQGRSSLGTVQSGPSGLPDQTRGVGLGEGLSEAQGSEVHVGSTRHNGRLVCDRRVTPSTPEHRRGREGR